MRVLEGLKVLDLSSFAAGPAASMVMADFGADVIKIEPPTGDPNRKVYEVPNLPVCDHNYAWTMSARSKRSVVLDLKSEGGRQALQKLAASADVLITNMPPAVRDRLNLGYDHFAAKCPRLIYASLTAHGETGPEANKPGFDATTYWARSGMGDLVRPSPDSPPANMAPGAGDYATAMSLFSAIMLALYRRERTGTGGMVHTSLLANGAWGNCTSLQGALSGGTVPNRLARTKPRNALTNYYQCGDGRWLIMSLINEAEMWPRLAEFLRIEPRLLAERFGDIPSRRANAEELVRVLDAIFLQRASADWKLALESAGLPVSVVATTGDAALDPQMVECGAFVPAAHAGGLGHTVDSPLWISGETKVAPRQAPELGEHTEEVLGAMGTPEEANFWRA